MVRYFSYSGCGTCRKAKKWLAEHSIEVEELAIRETPPEQEAFRFALQRGIALKSLFNTSGKDYRNPELKAKLPDLSEQQIIDLLSQQGNLVKRPFLVGEDIMLQGFKPDLWEEAFPENNLRK